MPYRKHLPSLISLAVAGVVFLLSYFGLRWPWWGSLLNAIYAFALARILAAIFQLLTQKPTDGASNAPF